MGLELGVRLGLGLPSTTRSPEWTVLTCVMNVAMAKFVVFFESLKVRFEFRVKVKLRVWVRV